MARIPAVTQFEVSRTLLGGYAVNYRCPHCQEQLTSKEDEIGRAEECPKCGNGYGVSRNAAVAINEAKTAKRDAERKRKEERERRKEERAANKPKCMDCGAPNTLLNQLIENYNGFLCEKHYNERLAKSKRDKQRQQQELSEYFEQQAKQVITTTSATIEGYRVLEYVGIDGVEVTVGTSMSVEIGIVFGDLRGARSKMLESKMRKGRLEAIWLFKLLAAHKGANGIIGIDFDYSAFGSNQTLIMVNGTLVRMEATGGTSVDSEFDIS